MSGPVSDERKGKVFDLQHFCLDDGPGIRTTVFLKGCPLRCIWCHNPESYGMEERLSFNRTQCVGCGECLWICPVQAHTLEDGIHQLNRNICTECGSCIDVCCYGALSRIGTNMTVKEILKEVLKDRMYYDMKKSSAKERLSVIQGGGMTVSGGEPFFQPLFLEILLQEAKENNIHICVETSGYAAPEHIEKAMPYIDMFLFDIKGARHDYKKLTGVDAEIIYKNLTMIWEAGKEIVIRIPLAAGVNDTERFFDELKELWIHYPGIKGFEIMPYHKMGAAKAENLAIRQGLLHQRDTTEEQKKRWLEKLHKRGVPVVIKFF